MNSKDLCMIEHIDDVIKAGVYSLKIEGRMKSLYYVAAVVKSYRQAVDAYMKDPDNYKFDPKWMENLNNVSHRQYHTGFYYGQNNEQVYEDSGYIRNADIVGIVRAYDEETKIATIEHKNKVLNGDTVEVLRAEGDNFEIVLHDMTEENGTPIDKAARAQMTYKVKVDIPFNAKDLLIKNKE